MRIHNGKYFYTVEHPKPNLLDIPPSCKDLIKKNDEIYEYDFKKFQQSTYQRSEYRLKSMIGINQNSDNYYGTSSRNNDLFQRKKQSYSTNLNGGLNFDYNNLQIDSNYGSTNDKKYGRGHDKSSNDDNFFTNKISMVPPPGDNIFGDKNSKSSSNNFNDKRKSNYNRDNGNSTNYNSNYDKFDLNSKPKRSSVQSYDYQDKTSSKYENISRTSNMQHQSKQHSSNSHKNFDNPVSHVKHDNNNSFATKTNSSSNANRITTANSSSNANRMATTNLSSNANRTSTTNSTAFTSNANRTSTTNSTFTSKINSSSKISSSHPTSMYPNGLESNSKYSKKAPVYDYSKPIPTGDDYSSQTKSYNSSKASKTKTTSSSNRNDFNIQNQRSSIHHNSSSITTSNNVSGRNNFNLKNQPSSIQSTTTTSSRPQYTSTSSNLTTNSVRQSKSSQSNQNSRFTTTTDLLNQIPQNYGSTTSQFQSRAQNQTRTSMQQPYYDDIRPPNLTQYNRPQVGNSSTFTNSTTTTTTTNSQAQFIAHQAQYSGNKNIPANPPTEIFSKKTAISNPGYDFLQKYGQDQSQSQSFNQGGANNDSFTIDPVPKKTRVEFPEPQTAPKPFQTIDASLEGEVSKEEAQKVEDLNDLMKSFHADSDSENNLVENENDKNKSKNTTTFNIDDLKKGLFSSFLEEEEEEAELENENQEDNEKNNKPLEDLSFNDDIEQKSKDFDQNINTFADEEESNKLEIASSEDSPIDSIPPNETKKQDNIQPNTIQINNNNKEEEEDMKDIQNFFDKIKKSIENKEEEDENTVDFIKQLEEDYNSQKQDNKIDFNNDYLIEDDQLEEDLIENIQDENRVDDDVFFEEEDLNAKLQNKQQQKKNEDIQNEDKTVEDVFLEEEENESMIEKVNADIYLSDDEDNQINMDKVDDENKLAKKNDLGDDFNLNFDNEEEESETDKSIEAIIKKANEQHLISDGNYEDEEEDESLLIEDNKTPISHFKKPLKFLAQNITNKYSSNNNGLELAFELADKILKKQLKKILSL